MARPYRPSLCSSLFRQSPKESERGKSPPTLKECETGHRSEPLVRLWAEEVEVEQGFVDPLMFSASEDIVFEVVLVVLSVEACTADNLRNGRTNVYD